MEPALRLTLRTGWPFAAVPLVAVLTMLVPPMNGPTASAPLSASALLLGTLLATGFAVAAVRRADRILLRAAPPLVFILGLAVARSSGGGSASGLTPLLLLPLLWVVVFGTRVDQLPESYRRYLLNSLRRDVGLGPVPLRMTMRASKNPFGDKGSDR